MKSKPYGFSTNSGYWGWIDSINKWRLFPTEGEYIEYLKEEEDGNVT